MIKIGTLRVSRYTEVPRSAQAKQCGSVPHGGVTPSKVTDRCRFALDVNLTQKSVFGHVHAPRLCGSPRSPTNDISPRMSSVWSVARSISSHPISEARCVYNYMGSDRHYLEGGKLISAQWAFLDVNLVHHHVTPRSYTSNRRARSFSPI